MLFADKFFTGHLMRMRIQNFSPWSPVVIACKVCFDQYKRAAKSAKQI